MRRIIVCTMCPRGCPVSVEGDSQEGRIDNMSCNVCENGRKFIENEFLYHVRVVTTTIKIGGNRSRMLPVHTSAPVPFQMMRSIIKAIKKQNVHAPIKKHQIIISNVLETGVDVVASMPLL